MKDIRKRFNTGSSSAQNLFGVCFLYGYQQFSEISEPIAFQSDENVASGVNKQYLRSSSKVLGYLGTILTGHCS